VLLRDPHRPTAVTVVRAPEAMDIQPAPKPCDGQDSLSARVPASTWADEKLCVENGGTGMFLCEGTTF
jgi:hypothetical protein